MFVVARQVTLVQIVTFKHFRVTNVTKWDIWQKICRSSIEVQRKPPKKKMVHHVEETAEDSLEEGDLYAVHFVPKLQKYKINVEINGIF